MVFFYISLPEDGGSMFLRNDDTHIQVHNPEDRRRHILRLQNSRMKFNYAFVVTKWGLKHTGKNSNRPTGWLQYLTLTHNSNIQFKMAPKHARFTTQLISANALFYEVFFLL
jgi:hypothetical protein